MAKNLLTLDSLGSEASASTSIWPADLKGRRG